MSIFCRGKGKDFAEGSGRNTRCYPSERLDTYTVIEMKDERTFTLLHRDGRMFSDVIFPQPMRENAQGCHIAVQLVTYNNKHT